MLQMRGFSNGLQQNIVSLLRARVGDMEMFAGLATCFCFYLEKRMNCLNLLSRLPPLICIFFLCGATSGAKVCTFDDRTAMR